MTQKNSSRQLAEEWDAAVERSTQDAPRHSQMGEKTFKHVAGLNLKSELRGGSFWSLSCGCTNTTCQQTCGCQLG